MKMTARVSPALKDALESRARAEGNSLSDVLRNCARAALYGPTPPPPAISSEQRGLLQLWETLRDEAPELADSLLRVCQVARFVKTRVRTGGAGRNRTDG